jgi:hypothetical protein
MTLNRDKASKQLTQKRDQSDDIKFSSLITSCLEQEKEKIVHDKTSPELAHGISCIGK